MDDIQIVRLLDVLNVNTVRDAPGVTPRSIEVIGEDFRSIEEVLLNGFTAPEFVVLTKTRLLAQVPAEIVSQPITNVLILSNRLTFTERSLVEFTFGTRPKKVSGILRLMQTFLRVLFRTPGTNLFHKNLGGGLQRFIGRSIGSGQNSRGRIAGEISVAVTRTRQQIVNVQTPDRRIPPSERLVGAELSAITIDPPNGQVLMTVTLTSQSGERAAATLAA